MDEEEIDLKMKGGNEVSIGERKIKKKTEETKKEKDW